MQKKCFLLLLTLSVFLISCSNSSDTLSFESMNTFMTIKSFGKNSKQANLLAQKEILNLENLISTTNPKSEVYILNHMENPKLQVNALTKDILTYALKAAEKTDGALNPALYPITSAWGFTNENYRIPDDKEISELLKLTDYSKISINENLVSMPKDFMIDLGAVGKGYAGDLAISILKSQGINSAILDLGGNIQTLGKKADGTNWSIGIKNPWGGNVIAGLQISNKAVITSGGYERYFTVNDQNYIHIFDSKTGKPVQNDIASISIITEKGLYGDALSTALFVMGKEKALEYWRKNKNSPDGAFDMIIISTDKKITYTTGLENNIQILAEFLTVEKAD